MIKATSERAELSTQRGRHLIIDLRVDILQKQVHGRVDRVKRALDPRAGGGAKHASANKQKSEYQPAMHGDICHLSCMRTHTITQSCHLFIPTMETMEGERGVGRWVGWGCRGGGEARHTSQCHTP